MESNKSKKHTPTEPIYKKSHLTMSKYMYELGLLIPVNMFILINHFSHFSLLLR